MIKGGTGQAAQGLRRDRPSRTSDSTKLIETRGFSTFKSTPLKRSPVELPVCTKQVVTEAIKSDKSFATAALLMLYEHQTQMEKDRRESVVKNRRGFNSLDARLFSDVAETLMQGGRLEIWRWVECRNRLGKYHRQICKAIQEQTFQCSVTADNLAEVRD